VDGPGHGDLARTEEMDGRQGHSRQRSSECEDGHESISHRTDIDSRW
jgi:hypothetical protein